MIAPLVMIGSGLVALVAIAGWWREMLQLADARAMAREIASDRDDAWDEVSALQGEIDGAHRKRSANARYARACQIEQERAAKIAKMHEIAATSGRCA